MKILTLNTHSLVENDYEQKLSDFVLAVFREKPQIIALQEVNQTCCEAQVSEEELTGYCPCDENAVIRRDNHVFNAVKILRENGVKYYWTWLPMKKGYDRYDEGIALMSLSPIEETKVALVSGVDDYNNWKTRKILGIRTENYPDEWFYSVHYGWWDDKEEPFLKQWEKTMSFMKDLGCVWLMGDFNSPAQVREEGYDLIEGSGWYDSFSLAKNKDSGITVKKVIDGWEEKLSAADGMRIDQIWCSKKMTVKSSRVIFNGENYPVVSDHCGVIIDFERSGTNELN